MRLIRRHGGRLRAHRRASWWASAGAAAVLLIAGALAHKSRSPDAHAGLSAVDGSPEANSRRLKSRDDSAYPDDPLVDRPYEDAPPHQKVRIIIHIILIGYMLLGLNTVCDAFFCGALDMMVDKWNVQADVAGATFMAAGGSAPELFTSLIGAVITENDVGFGTIVGSAVFNVLAVIGACGLSVQSPLKLAWWPLLRDCTYYIFGLGMLATFAYGETLEDAHGNKDGGGVIEWWEASILFMLYLVYCIIMYNNEAVEAWVKSFGKVRVLPMPDDDEAKPEMGDHDDESSGQLQKSAQGDEAPGPPQHHIGRDQAGSDVLEGVADPERVPSKKQAEAPTHQHYHIDRHIRVVHHHVLASPHGSVVVPHESQPPSRSPRPSEASCAVENGDDVVGNPRTSGRSSVPRKETFRIKGRTITLSDDDLLFGGRKNTTNESNRASADDSDCENVPSETSAESDDIEAMMIRPEGTFDRVIWCLSLPIYVPLYYGIPKPSGRWFLATFGLSLLWIAGFSFILVYCVEIFGAVVFGGGNSVTIVMSLTLLAAGTSIPDLVSSMAVARAGEGDMALSSSVGSNIFDILVGLPIPWIIKIVIVESIVEENTGYSVAIKSPYIALYVILLLFMVFCVVVSIHFLGWCLDRKLGLCMALLYVVFLSIVLPVELINKGPYI